MRIVKYLALLMLVFSCKTKTVTVEKSSELEKESLSRYFDSLFQQSLKLQLEWQKNQSSLTDNLKLTSFTELDSLGNRKPFHFKHYVDGNLKEEIYLEGGEINKETASTTKHQAERKTESKQEKTLIDVDVGQKKEVKKKTLNRKKEAETKGLQFGFYVWLFFIIIAILVLRWIAKKFNLIDKLKTVLQLRGG